MRPLVVAAGAWPAAPPRHRVVAATFARSSDDAGDDAWLWTGADDGGIVRWRARGDALARDDAGAWRALAFLSGHTRRVNALEHVPPSPSDARALVISAGDDGVACAWDVADGACVARRALGEEGCAVTALARVTRADGEPLVAAAVSSRDHAVAVKLVHPRTLAVLAVLDAPPDTPRVLAVVPDDGADERFARSSPRLEPEPETETERPSSRSIDTGTETVRLTLFTDDRSRVVHLHLDVRVDDARERSAPSSPRLSRPTSPRLAAAAAANASFAALGWNRPRANTSAVDQSAVDHPSIDANRRDGVDGSYSTGIRTGTAARSAPSSCARDGSRFAAAATDEDGGRVWVLVDAATDASFTLAPPEGTAFDSNARVAFLSAPPSRRERESEISESRSTTSTAATTRPAVAAVDLGGGGSFLTRVASAAEIFFGSRDDLVATEKEAAAFYEATSRVESSRIESTAREDVVAAGLADGRVALFRVRDDGGAKNATLTAILDVSRGWRRLDDIAARAGSNPVPATTATLFTVADDSAATFASSSSSLESIASLVSGDDAGNLRVERVPLGAGFPSHVVPRAHVGEVTCISDAGGGTFLTGGVDGATTVWDATRANEPPRRVATLRHHVSAIRAVVPLDVHGDGRGGGAGGPAAAACTVDGDGAVGLVSIPRRRPGEGESDAFRDHLAPRCEALFPAAPGRGALESVLWDPAAGALSCVFVRIPRIQRGTNPENPEEHDAAANENEGRSRAVGDDTRHRLSVVVWDVTTGVLDRVVEGAAASAYLRHARATSRRWEIDGPPAWSPPGSADARRASAAPPPRAVDGHWTQPGAPYLLVNARVAADASGSAPRALANARLAAATTRAWREDETVDEGDDDDAVAVAALLGESPGVHAPRRMTRANIGAGGAVTIRLPGSGWTDSNADVERALASLALTTRASELADKLAAKENAVAGSNLEPVGERATKPSETGCAPATNLATVLANHRRRTTSSFANDAFAAAADASALTRHRNSPCDAIRRASRQLFALVLARAVPPHLTAPPSPTAFEFEPATLRSPDGAVPLVVAAAARLANPAGVHPRLRDVVAPALVALLRAPRATHVADAASLLSEGVKRDGWIAAMDGPSRERLHDDAFHLADALAGDAGTRPWSPKRISGVDKTSERKTPGTTPEAARGSRSSSSPKSPPPEAASSSPKSPRSPARADEHVGAPADLMSARQAVSDLLSALARASPAWYAVRLARRLRVARADSPANAVAVFALARVAREHPEALEPHLDVIVDTALREALNPNTSASRRSCAAAATAVASEIGVRSPRAAFHRESAKLVVAAVGARPGGTLASVFDLATATRWRSLEDADEGASADGMATVGQQMANAFGFGGFGGSGSGVGGGGGGGAGVERGGVAARSRRSIGHSRSSPGPSPRSSMDAATRSSMDVAIPKPRTPEQAYAAASAAAAMAMRSRKSPPTSPTAAAAAAAAAAFGLASGTNSRRNSLDATHARSAPPPSPVHVAALAFDPEGNRVAAYLDRKSFVYVWTLSSTWRPFSGFAKTASAVGCSHMIPCVPSAAFAGGDVAGVAVGKDGAEDAASLEWTGSNTVTLRRGGICMSFGVN